MPEENREEFRKEMFAPLDDDERRDIRKLHRESFNKHDHRQLENWLEGAKLFATQTGEIRKSAMTASIDYGKIFVQFAFFLNGGAMIALLTFSGTLFSRADIGAVAIAFASKLPLAFGIYSAGLVLAALSAAAGYANFQFVFGSHLGEGHLMRMIQAGNAFKDLDLEEEKKAFEKIDKWLDRTLWAGVISGGLSLIAFIAATFVVARAFFVLGV